MLTCFTEQQLTTTGEIKPIALIKYKHSMVLSPNEELHITYDDNVINIVINSVEDAENNIFNETKVTNLIKRIKSIPGFPFHIGQENGFIWIVPINDHDLLRISCSFGSITNNPVSVIGFTIKHKANEVLVESDRRIYTYLEDQWKQGEYQDRQCSKPFQHEHYSYIGKEVINEAIKRFYDKQKMDGQIEAIEEKIESIDQLKVVPTNELDNSSFSIHQRVPFIPTKRLFNVDNNVSVYIIDRWMLRSYKRSNQMTLASRIEHTGKYHILLENKDGGGSHGLEQRVNVYSHNIHMFDYNEAYTIGTHIEPVVGEMRIKVVTYLLFGDGIHSKHHHEVSSKEFNISQDRGKQIIYDHIDFKSHIQTLQLIDDMKARGQHILYEGVSFIPVSDEDAKVKIYNPFLVKGIWHKKKYPEMLFNRDHTSELLACQRYYQRIIDACAIVPQDMNENDVSFITTINFSATMVNVPKIKIKQKNNKAFLNKLYRAPNIIGDDCLELSAIQTDGDFALNPTTERFHIQGTAKKDFHANHIVIYSWEAECEE